MCAHPEHSRGSMFWHEQLHPPSQFNTNQEDGTFASNISIDLARKSPTSANSLMIVSRRPKLVLRSLICIQIAGKDGCTRLITCYCKIRSIELLNSGDGCLFCEYIYYFTKSHSTHIKYLDTHSMTGTVQWHLLFFLSKSVLMKKGDNVGVVQGNWDFFQTIIPYPK
jgi:hypothetical protein